MTPALRARLASHAVAGSALLLAVVLGVLAATDARDPLVAGVGATILAIFVGRWFRRDPVMALVALWAFQVVRTPLAAATQSLPVAGTLIDQLTDVCLLIILLTLAWEAAGPSAPRRDLRYFWPAVALACCGLAGSVLEHAPLHPTLAGLWLGTKLWLLVGVTATVDWRRGDVDRVLRVLCAFGAAAAVLGLFDAATGGRVADVLNSDLGVTPFETYRMHAAQSVYSHPGEYGLAMSLLVAIWLARVVTMTAPRPRDVALLGLFIVGAVVSLRLKAVLCVTSVIAIVGVVQVARLRRHALKMIAAGALVVALVVVFMGNVIRRQLAEYTSSGPTARSQLYDAGAQIASDRFPFGVGFGRFGSAPSTSPYSAVYDEYGLSRTWGLSRAFSRFATDTSWPAVMGEAGIAGLLVFAAGLLALATAGVRTLRAARGPDAWAPLALLAVLAVVLVDATGSSTLFSWNTSMVLALVAGPTLAQQRVRLAARRRALVPLARGGRLTA